MSIFRTTAEIDAPDIDDQVEIPITVHYTFNRAIKGKRDEYGVPLEPDEKAHVIIDKIETKDGKEIKLSVGSERVLVGEIGQYIMELERSRGRDD
jgi:hypothetical protein